MLTAWGVRDESVGVHSLGFNYLAALGRHLGFWAATEFRFELAIPLSAQTLCGVSVRGPEGKAYRGVRAIRVWPTDQACRQGQELNFELRIIKS